MKKQLFLLLFLPFSLFAQVYDIATDAPHEELSSEEAFRRSIPADFKTGKPHYFRYQSLAGYILNDSILIPCKYESLDNKFSDLMVCREPRKLFGAINKKGETVIPFEYRMLNQYVIGTLFGYKKDQGYGLMTTAGKVLVPFEYQKGITYDSVFVFSAPGKQLAVKVLTPENLQVLMEADFEEIRTEQTGHRPFFAVKQQGLWGVADYQKRFLIPCAYDKIESVLGQFVTVSKAGKMGLVDMQGKVQIALEYETIAQRLKNGLFQFGKTVSSTKKLWGLMDSTGLQVLPVEYDQIEQFYYCDLMKVKKDGKYGILDVSGKFRTPLQFSDIMGWKHVTVVEKKDGAGNIRQEDEDKYGIYFVYKFVENNNKVGLWHLDKGQIFPPEYDYFDIKHPNGPITVSKGDKRGLYSMQGKQLIAIEYDALAILNSFPDFALGYQQDKRTLVSIHTGKPIQQEYYDDWLFHNAKELNGYFYTKKGLYLALHAPDGRRLTPHQYRMGFRHCAPLPDVESKLPAGRKIVACSFREKNGGLVNVAIDNTGAEYEYEEK